MPVHSAGLPRRVLSPFGIACLTIVLLGLIRQGAAQDDPPAPPVAEGGEEAATAEPPAPPRFLFIPYTDLKTALQDLNSSVMLPLSEYLKLKQGAVAAPGGNPAGAVITSADYSAVVEKDLVNIHATLKVNVLGKPWLELPISFGEAAVGKVTTSSEKVLLRGTNEGGYTLMLGEAGEHTVELELVAKIQSLPDGRQLVFATPAVAVTTFELKIPDADQTVEIQPRQVALPVEAAEQETHVRASVGATTAITAKWFPAKSATPQMELLTSASVEQIISAEEGLLHRDAWLKFETLRGQVQQLRIAAPKGHRVLDVAGDAKIRGWKAAEEGNRQVITVDLLAPTSEPVNVEVHTEGPLPEGPFAVAGLAADGQTDGIHALDVVRESGQLSVRAGSGFSLTIADQQGLSRIDAAQTAERLRAEGASAFQYFTPAFTLRVEVKPIEPRLLVTHEAQLVFHEDELRLVAQLNYTIERAGVFELQLKAPDNLVIDGVESPALKEFRLDETSRILIVTLNQKTIGAVGLVIRGHRAFSAATDMTEQTLPLVEPLKVDRELGTVYVFAKEAIDVVVNEEGVVAAQPLASPPGLQSGDARLTSAWTFTRRPVAIPVKTIRKPVRLSADVATTIRVQPQLTEVETLLTFVTEYAGLDTFVVMVPEAVSERLRIESNDGGIAIRQKTPAAPADGWVAWTVVMQREVLGRVPLKITYDIRSAAAGAAANAALNDSLSISILRPLGTKAVGDVDVALTRVSGQVVVVKDDSLSVTTTATGGDVEPIDVRELTMLPQTGASAYRYFRQPTDAGIAVAVTRTRNEVQPVVATIVRRGLVEVVAGDKTDAAATFRCRYLMKTSERQRLLVQLPVGMELLGAFVNDRDARLEKADLPAGRKLGESWDAYWLNVAREGDDEAEFAVTFQFLWKLNPPLGGSSYGRGGLELPLPAFGPKEEPAAVQDLRVVVWAPREFILVGEPDGFLLVDRPDPWRRITGGKTVRDPGVDAWMGQSDGSSAASLPREGRVAFVYSNVGGAPRLRVDWWRLAWTTWIVSIAVAVIALVLLKTSWENKLTTLLIGAFGLLLYSLKDYAGAVELLASARFGLLFLLALWLVHALFGRRSAVRTSPPPATPAPAMSPGGP